LGLEEVLVVVIVICWRLDGVLVKTSDLQSTSSMLLCVSKS